MTEQEQTSFYRWLKGIPYEIKFWSSFYNHRKSLEQLYSWSDYGKECRLDNFDVQDFISRCGERPVMLDVGCAMSYVLGTKFDNPGAELHLIDPLARFYNRILDESKIDRQRLREGMIELLSTIYAPGSVDLVHVRNALDHCANPLLGIMEGLQVLRRGGVLYLHHHINEAVRESYNGFHQYNIDCVDGRLVIWNREQSIDVARELEGFADVECSICDDTYVVAIITRTADLPADRYNPADTPRRATEMMNIALEAFNKAGFAFSYHWHKFIAGIAHPVMRRIPRSIVEKLKAAIRRLKK